MSRYMKKMKRQKKIVPIRFFKMPPEKYLDCYRTMSAAQKISKYKWEEAKFFCLSKLERRRRLKSE